MLVTVSALLPQAKEAAAAVGMSDDQLIVLDGADATATPAPPICSLRAAPPPEVELRPGDPPGRAALQLGHDRQPQGRDADPSQPGRQRRADPAGAGRAARRRRHRDHAVLPHLRNDGVAQRRSACAGAPGDDAQLRSRRVPRQHPEPQGHRRLHRAAGGGRARQASVGEQLRPVVAARGAVRRRTAGRGSRPRRRRPHRLSRGAGLRHDRAQPRQPLHSVGRRQASRRVRRSHRRRRLDGGQLGLQARSTPTPATKSTFPQRVSARPASCGSRART